LLYGGNVEIIGVHEIYEVSEIVGQVVTDTRYLSIFSGELNSGHWDALLAVEGKIS
jgi:hypothetical protein